MLLETNLAEKTDARTELARVRAGYFRKILDLIPLSKRSDGEFYIAQIEQTTRALEAISEISKTEVVEPRAVEFILHILNKEDRAIAQDRLIEMVLEMGFESKNPSLEQRRGNVKRSIGQYLKGVAGSRRKVLKQINGKIGKGDWPESRFSR